MKNRLLEQLRCPSCHGQVSLVESQYESGEVKNGRLKCAGCESKYPVYNFIPRFVGDDNYAGNFGFQWNRHARTQIDKFNGTQISYERFYTSTKWVSEELEGQQILEAGCGAGRFTQIMTDAGAEVFSFDYSNAVDASLSNNGLLPNLHIFQGDIYRIPFEKQHFDKIFCFGVLQHTPDVKKSLFSLIEYLKPGGEIAIDVYPKALKARLHPRYFLRPITKRMDPARLYSLVEKAVPVLLPVSSALQSIPILGRYLYPLIPVANYHKKYSLQGNMLYDLAILDTFDWLSPRYDQPQTMGTIRSWFEEAGLVDIQIRRIDSIVGKAKRPSL